MPEKILRLTSKLEGADALTVTMADGRNYRGASARLPFETRFLPYADPVLANNTWDIIGLYCALGMVPETWQVGDAKPTDLTGDDVGTYNVQIIGKNQDDLDPSDEHYNDPNYNGGSNKAALTFQFSELLRTYRRMHSTNDNTTGWFGSEMRQKSMPLILGEMDASLRAVMRKVVKKTPYNSSISSLNETEETLFLLGPHEVLDTSDHYYIHTAIEGPFYDYYAAGNSPIKKRLYSSSSYSWHLRNPAYNGKEYFARIDANGNLVSSYATHEIGVAPAFCI